MSSTTLRPCRLLPPTGSGEGPPDGHYVATLNPVPGAEARTHIYIDNSSAGYYYQDVPVSPAVTVLGQTTEPEPRSVDHAKNALGSGGYAAVTVENGIVVAIDPGKKDWDTQSGLKAR